MLITLGFGKIPTISVDKIDYSIKKRELNFSTKTKKIHFSIKKKSFYWVKVENDN